MHLSVKVVIEILQAYKMPDTASSDEFNIGSTNDFYSLFFSYFFFVFALREILRDYCVKVSSASI